MIGQREGVRFARPLQPFARETMAPGSIVCSKHRVGRFAEQAVAKDILVLARESAVRRDRHDLALGESSQPRVEIP